MGGEGTHCPENRKELISFGFAFEKWFQEIEFGQDASYCPNIDGSGVSSDT